MKLTGRSCPFVLCLMVCSMAVAQQPPAPVAQPQGPEDIERMFSVGAYGWMPSGGPSFRGGVYTFDPAFHNLKLPQKPARAYGATLTIPMKGSTRLEVSYLTLNDSGSALAPRDLSLFAGNILKDEPLAMDYSLRHVKVVWNYLTYPNPPQDAKLRIKTLWEFHFMQVKPTVVLTATAPDQPLSQNMSIKIPAAGLGLEYVPSNHFRLEFRGSGMAWPKRSALWDAEATAVVRVRSLEIFAGGKGFYFRTSPQKEIFVEGTLWGPYGGLRWVFR